MTNDLDTGAYQGAQPSIDFGSSDGKSEDTSEEKEDNSQQENHP